MALRAVTTPLDPRTQSEWQAHVCEWNGVAYASLKTAAATEVDRIIDEIHFRVLQRHGHEPWGRRVWTLTGSDFTAPSTTTGLFELPSDLYQIISIQESESGTGATARFTRMEDWMAAGAGLTTHPWSNQSEPYYFYKAMSDDNPPVQTWQRIPTPSAAITAMTILGRGYPTLLGTSGDTTYAEIPAAYVREMIHDARSMWAAFQQNYDVVAQETRLREDAVRMTQIADAPDGAEVKIVPNPPDEFFTELEI